MVTIADGELTSIALCWTLERPDGGGIALTSHDQAVVRNGVAHEPSPGILPAAISRSLGLDAQSGEVTGALSANALDEHELALGRWNGARARLSAIDWRDADAGGIGLLGGEIGTVSLTMDGFSADVRGAAAKLGAQVCPSTSAECRAHFGDKQCRIDLAGRSAAFTVVTAEDGEITLDAPVDGRFLLGRLRYLSGANCGIATVVIGVGEAVVRVRDLPRAAIETGCRVELREGCDKRFETCVSRFANAVNFRGEPHLPGSDLLTRYPGI